MPSRRVTSFDSVRTRLRVRCSRGLGSAPSGRAWATRSQSSCIRARLMAMVDRGFLISWARPPARREKYASCSAWEGPSPLGAVEAPEAWAAFVLWGPSEAWGG
jgi:hypothetical protein